MLERLDRRSITLLDVVALCNREATSLRIQESGNRAVVPHPSTPHVLHAILCNCDFCGATMPLNISVNCVLTKP